MDSEEPVKDDTVTEVPEDNEKGPLSNAIDITVEPGTEATAEPEEPTIVVAAAESKPQIVLHRSNSAPPPEEEEPSDNLLSQEALAHAKLSPKPEVPDKSTSLSSVDPNVLPSTGQLSSLSEGEFEEFINSPRGQNVIVERSPGGRYVRFMEKLGSGASKDVYRAYDTTEGIEVAWNVVNLAGVPKAERNRIVNEVRLLERLHHHNIISFHGSWVNRERQEVNFVTEILSSGTLKSFIDKVQVIRWKIAKRWARQVLNGLAYLHEQDPPVIHRDLKCDNIFINGTSGDLRIGDLGLSTVHRNGKVLSVLGTPEFMAPDLYEESSYDEKVDIYAFGMVLLEIFTKDVPYRECANPAQIYRKVIRGEPPESLSRVRSQEARDFITFCLGYKDEETGKYVRPSAAELLNHPFLGTGADDDSEVEVDPPLMEHTIREEGAESESQRSTTPKGVTTKIQIPAPPRQPPEASEMPPDANAASQQVHLPTPAHRSPVPARRDGMPPRPNPDYRARQNSLEDDSDHFDEMPDSEVNIVRKVKVMMGRGQELENTEGELPAQVPIPLMSNVEQPTGAAAPPPTIARPDENAVGGYGQGMEQVSRPQAAQQHFLVAAAVIEEESPLVRPYNDDILKLIIRLPVEGQTQNVQFDFHLIEDDPIQVAKEMVTELGIPQDAILEISETISGHARNARMKQEMYNSLLKWQQEQQMMPQNIQNQAMQQPGMMMPQHQQHHQPSHEDQQMRGMVHQQPQHVNQNMPIQVASGPAPGSEGYALNQQQMPSAGGHQQPLSHPQTSNQGQLGDFHHIPPPSQILNSRSLSGGQLHKPMYTQAPAGSAPHDGNPSQQMHMQQHVPRQQMMQQAQAPVQQPTSHEFPYPGSGHVQYVAAPTQVQQPQPTGQMPTQPEAPTPFVQPQAQTMQPHTVIPPAESAVPQGQVPPHDSQSQPPMQIHENGDHDPFTEPDVGSGSVCASQPRHTVESESGLSSDTDGVETFDEDDGEDEDESAFKEEMRRLDEDFKKNMLRAQKVFDSRMDNLQRSKEEREAQHLKTLEKHEKERAEFEKRLRQAEKEQNRRIEQLQREWDKKRASLAKHKGGKMSAADVPPADEKMTELTQSNAESLGSMTSSTNLEKPVAPTHKKSASTNNSESSERSRSSSSSLNGDFGGNAELT